jgi:hypothetical protein
LELAAAGRRDVEAAANIFITLPDSVFLRTADGLRLVTAMHHRFAEI